MEAEGKKIIEALKSGTNDGIGNMLKVSNTNFLNQLFSF